MIAIVVHGGAGGTSSDSKRGCLEAAQIGIATLKRRANNALRGAVDPIVSMENSGIFNAGVGSILRYSTGNEEIMEMDALVAVSSMAKIFGGVGAVTGIRNPVLLALAVLTQTDHHLLTGAGAMYLARELNLEPHPGPTPAARTRLALVRRDIEEGRLAAPDIDLKAFRRMIRGLGGNGSGFAHSGAPKEGDTVGAITLDEKCTLAVASSTGGSSVMIRGRVGDVPVRSSGWQLGEHGAVLATGYGEIILQREGAGRVYDLMTQGVTPQRACEQVAEEFPVEVGFIALNKQGSIGIGANCEMDTHSIVE